MQATVFGSWRRIVFNSRDILYIVEDGFKCDTHLTNGKTIPLSWNDMRNLLDKLPRVFCYKYHCPVYINQNEITSYSSNGCYVAVEFKNGMQLKELSLVDFERNLLPTLELGKEI